MHTNADITLYSWQTGDKYIRSVIKDVLWMEVKQSNIEKTGLTSADSVKIFIPGSSLPEGGLKFTTSKDMVIKGIVTTEIDNASQATTTNSVKALKAANDVYCVSAADGKFYGSHGMQHYQLSCK
jgi:hypothetical protein